MKRIKTLTLLLAMLAASMLPVSCSDNNDPAGDPEEPTAGTSISAPVTKDITPHAATVQALVTTTSPGEILKKGFCYSTGSAPDLSSSTVEMNSAGLSLECTLNGLKAETRYYVRAFVSLRGSNPVYSAETSFTTAQAGIADELEQYVAPTYADDYTSISDWSKRSQWNLANVHDPSVVLAEDGYYYMYQTDASYGDAHKAGGHFHARRSKDLVNWEYLGGTMKNLPEWVVPKLNEIRKEMGLAEVNPNTNDFGYWAPVVHKVKSGLYRMYYSIVCPGTLSGANSWSERAFIGLMENSNPANNDGWVDKGYVITNASDKGLDFNVRPDDWANCYYKWNAIDPSYVITPEGEHWLVYGSWHSGIAALKLDGETGKPAATLGAPWATGQAPAEYGQLIATRQAGNRWQASEGPEVVYRDGYYYLFLAYDALDVPYNTRVVRSKSITGPYVGIDGKDVTAGADALPVVTHPYKFSKGHGWVGIAHCAIFDDGKDNWYYASQGRFPVNVGGNAYSNAIMMGHIRSIRWTSDGWPVVMPERYGAVPQVPITEEELVGNWENIDLSYAYGQQKTAETLTLGADHKVTAGIWKGAAWSYDAARQVLTISGIELCLQREVDWEASPRTHTLVYAGYSGTKTFWGKKSK